MNLATTVLPLAAVTLVLYRAVRISPSAGSKIGAVLAIMAGITPAIWVMSAQKASPKLVVGYGVLFFAGSVLIKWAVTLKVLSKYVYPRAGLVASSVAQGVFSSACEMGVAAVALGSVLPNIGFWQVFGFGAGAAAVEALIVSVMENLHAGTDLGEHVGAQFAKLHEGPRWLDAAVPFVERCIATTDHIACRGLVAAGIATGRVWPTALAFLAFAATDGFAGYCLARRWEFSKPAVAAKLYGILAIVAVAGAAAWGFAQP